MRQSGEIHCKTALSFSRVGAEGTNPLRSRHLRCGQLLAEHLRCGYHCDRLVWFEAHQEVSRAIAREKVLKGWSRAKKIALIESANPAWVDLSRDWYDCEPADYRRALDRMDS